MEKSFDKEGFFNLYCSLTLRIASLSKCSKEEKIMGYFFREQG
jgi:hypothetical protein